MKNLIPAVVIVCMGMLTFTSSCGKKKSTATCTCTQRGSNNHDTVVSFTTIDTPFTNLSDECQAADALLKFDSTHYGCHL